MPPAEWDARQRAQGKPLRRIARSLLLSAAVLGSPALHLGASPSAHAQAPGVGPTAMQALLLRPWGWLVEWRNPLYEISGETGVTFHTRGDKLVVDIEFLVPPFHTCEREATLIPGGIQLDGCVELGVTILFDPTDPDYPFKGKSGIGTQYRFRAK